MQKIMHLLPHCNGCLALWSQTIFTVSKQYRFHVFYRVLDDTTTPTVHYILTAGNSLCTTGGVY
jgi:hypothetical protein